LTNAAKTVIIYQKTIREVFKLNDLLLEIKGLKTYFYLDEGTVKAVDGVDFDIPKRGTIGVVGESGCGKSVTAQSILRIVPHPGRIIDGKILLHQSPNGQDEKIINLAQLDPNGRLIRDIRGKEIAMIFQEPMTSFSPVHTIGNQIMEAILLHQNVTKSEAREHAIEILDKVGIPFPQRRIDQYSHQLSGGMRQRAMIAMALSCNPRLLIADEPTTALDVTIQAQILTLMKSLQEEFGMSIMIITHNLGVVAEMADDVVVMYLGEVVEHTDVETLFYRPKHPYTRALLKSIPKVGRKMRVRLESIKGTVPDPFMQLKGCPFHPRCPEAISGVCNADKPPLVEAEKGHKVACFLYGGR
jgi:peptide/nickel transport system ATP-binding protein